MGEQSRGGFGGKRVGFKPRSAPGQRLIRRQFSMRGESLGSAGGKLVCFLPFGGKPLLKQFLIWQINTIE